MVLATHKITATEHCMGILVSTYMLTSIETTTNLLSYLDGGTSSLILQAILAGSLTLGYGLKLKWHAFKAFLARAKTPRTH